MPTVPPVLLIGSRSIPATPEVVAWYNRRVEELAEGLPAVVITGGAVGGDYLGAMFAVHHGLPLELYLPYGLAQAPLSTRLLVAAYSGKTQVVEGGRYVRSFRQAALRRNLSMVNRMVVLGGTLVVAVVGEAVTPGTGHTLAHAAASGLSGKVLTLPKELRP